MTNGKLIGVMLDPACQQFKHDRYEWYVDWFSRWGFNALFLNLADDIACSIELKSYPQLTSAHAMSQDEMRDLIAYAKERGMDIIPHMPLFGHSGYIFHRDGFRHLKDHQDRDRNCICVSKPEARKVIATILDEIMELFPSRFIHVGFDETGSHPKKSCLDCREKFKDMLSWEVELYHLNWLREQALKHGKRLMIYLMCAHVDGRVADMSACLPKDVVCTHWDYGRDVERSPVKLCLDRGLDYLGCSAVGSTGIDCFVPNSGTLANQDIFVRRLSRDWADEKVLGMFCALWGNHYTFYDTRVYGAAYAADRFRHPEGNPDFPETFCQSFWGVDDPRPLSKIMVDIHAASPGERKIDKLLRLDIDNIQPCDLEYIKERAERMKIIARELRDERSRITQNIDIFDAFILSADVITFLGKIADREVLSASVNDRNRTMLEDLAARARNLAERAWENWDVGFPEDDKCKRNMDSPNDHGDPVEIDKHCYMNGPKNAFYTVEKIARFFESKLVQAEQERRK